MATANSGIDHSPGDSEWDALVQKSACKAARRQGLLDWTDDLAQEIRLLLWKAYAAGEAVDPPWITRKANAIARKEVHRRRKHVDLRFKVAKDGGDARDLADDVDEARSRTGIPDLCEGLARLAEPGRARRALDRLILACALVVIEDVLGMKRGSGRRYLIFRGAYEKHMRIGNLAAKYKKSPDAITEQLRRMSKAIQHHLLGSV
jgi:hypothetical protein